MTALLPNRLLLEQTAAQMTPQRNDLIRPATREMLRHLHREDERQLASKRY
jgi:hypothetical protein